MNLSEINRKVEEINDNLKNLQSTSINTDIGKLEQKMSQLELALMRPGLGNDNMQHNHNELNQLIRGDHLPDLNVKSLSSNHDYGGETIIPQLHKHIISKIALISPMRKLANIETTSSNAMDFIVQDGDFIAKWVKEESAREDTDNPKLVQRRIPVHELYAQPSATSRLLDDSAVNISEWLSERLVDSFARAENQAFINGGGENEPRGILKSPDVTQVEFRGNNITPEALLNLISSLDEQYLARATFMMNRTTLSEIQKLKDNSGRFIWQPTISRNIPETLFGIPIVCSNEMPNLATDKTPTLAIALGDFKAAYTIVDRDQFSLTKDPYTNKPFIRFYAVKRVGGDVINSQAIKLLKVIPNA